MEHSVSLTLQSCLFHHHSIPCELWRIIEGYRVRSLDGGEEEIRDAVELWFADQQAAMLEYGHISDWDTSQVTSMAFLFQASIRRDQCIPSLSLWNTSKVTSMAYMFSHWTTFNQSIGHWDVSKVTDMRWMFHGCLSFNQPLDKWDVSSVTNMSQMFRACHEFNQPLGSWRVSQVTNMEKLFEDCLAFNQPLTEWDVQNVEKARKMFANATAFNQPLHTWRFSHSQCDRKELLRGATSYRQTEIIPSNEEKCCTDESLRHRIQEWRYDPVTNAAFHGHISQWDVSRVTDMSRLFAYNTNFNEPLNDWDVSNVTNMRRMFWEARAFNQPLDKWNVRKVQVMNRMFDGADSLSAEHRRDIRNIWQFGRDVDKSDMFGKDGILHRLFLRPFGF